MMFGQPHRIMWLGVLVVVLLSALVWAGWQWPAPVLAQSSTFTPTWTWLPPTATPSVPQGLPIPPQAVVGRVTQDTLVYWAPRESALVPIVLPAGKTAWVLGVDASGHYYKIIWADRYLWVPAETMGPNTDALWQGAPLPTEVVE